VLAGNLKRQTGRVRVFEIGRCFLPAAAAETGYRQPLRVAALAAGPALPEQWGAPARAVDFHDLKGDLEALFAPRPLVFARHAHPALHPGRSAQVLLDGKEIGALGELHPELRQKHELPAAVALFEIDLAALLETPLPAYVEVSRFPAVVRDLALVVPLSCAAAAVQDVLRAAAPGFVREIQLFDVYHGEGVAPDCKSLAFRVAMQDTRRTLADADADAALAGLLEAARAQCGARLRS